MARRKKTYRPDKGGPRPRSLAQFEREVTALLFVGHGIHPKFGHVLVAQNKKYVKTMWSSRRPPCACSDRLAQKAKNSRKRYARDADNPKEGEVYESRAGNRWRVVGTNEKGIEVERAGHRQSGKLKWSRGALKGMKEVEGRGQLSLFRDPDRRRRRRRASRARVRRRRSWRR